MSDTAILAAAFHDTPGLLAVRLSHPRQAALAFATTRRPDVTRGKSSSGGCTGLLIVGVIAGIVVISNVGSCSGGSGDEVEAASRPVISAPMPADSAGSRAWAERADDLGDDFEPQRADLRPWAVRSLLDVPRELARRGAATGGWLQPACSAEDRRAHARGRRLAAQLADGGLAAGTAVILDLPGSQAVAAAAGMAATFDPVFTSDSLPHPQGVVPSAQTLAAALYWRPDLASARGRRDPMAGPCFILEGDRLNPYANQPGLFDNRTRARLPGAQALRGLGVQRVVYVRPQRGAVAEADDLNELLAALPAAGIEVRHVGLDAVEAEEAVEPESATPASRSHAANTWLWLHTGWGTPSAAGQPDPDAGYRVRPRPVMAFSNLDGGASGRGSVIDRLVARPPPRPVSSSGSSGSGGSWFRSSSSHHFGS